MGNEDKDVVLLQMSLSRLFLTFREKAKLFKSVENARELSQLNSAQLVQITGRNSKSVWNGPENYKEAYKEYLLCQKLGIKTVFYQDDEYPALLKEIDDPPFMLFYRGNLEVLNNPCVSVVGTRRLTAGAAKAAVDFAQQAAQNGLTVVSGLAFGADGKAHTGALNAPEGKTCAVLPGGIDNIVPHSHTRLAARILENGGCLLSEYAPGTEAEPWRFVQRNRIIAGLSPVTVVIQAPPGSGAMHTAAFALDYNRDVMFHKEAFSDASLKISDIARKALEYSEKACDRSKLKNDPELYVRDGAAVIDSFEDYCRCLTEVPGEHNITNYRQRKDIQFELFENTLT